MRPLLAILVALSSLLPLAAQSIALRPGSYEATMDMEMPGGAKMPPHKATQCITADDLKDFSKAFGDPDFAKSCKVSDYKVAGSKLTFSMDCTMDGLRMKGTTEMTFTSDTFNGVTKTTDDKGRTMVMKTSAKRVGECAK